MSAGGDGNSGVDVVTKGPFAGMTFPKKQVVPSDGEVKLQCGNCKHFDFEIHVKPVLGIAMMKSAICRECLRIYNVSETGALEGSGTVTYSPRDEMTRPNLSK